MAQVGKDPNEAFFLSVVPGLGHVYCGRMLGGMVWLALVLALYWRSPPTALLAHFVCALSARGAAMRTREEDVSELRRRLESPDDVARGIEDAARKSPAAAAPAGPPPDDPPARHLRAAFPVPPEALLRALADAFVASGLVLLGMDLERGVVRASEAMEGGLAAHVEAHVEPTPSGSRARFTFDRPPGAPRNPGADDRRLRALLEVTERMLGLAAQPAAPRPAPAPDPGEPVTEDVFLARLREAWEAWDNGEFTEEEWLQRKRGLLRALVLRPDTRASDFLGACKPLLEAEVLSREEMGDLERSIRVG